MKMRKIKALALSLIMVLTVAFSAACDKDPNPQATLPEISLDILTEDTAEIGFAYEIQSAYGVDTEGTLYTPQVSVKVKGGADVTITNNSFTPTVRTDHIITFTISENGQNLEKTCTVRIVDTTAPNIQINLPSNVRPDVAVTPDITITDNSGSVKESETKVLYKGSREITLDAEGSFIAEKGYYVFDVSAKDNDGNASSKTVEMAVIPAQNPYNDFASGESFEYGYDSNLITHTGANAVLTYDAKGVTEGDFALKMSVPGDHGFTTLSYELLSRIAAVYETVSFDFTNGGQNMHEIAMYEIGTSTSRSIANVQPGDAITYTIDKNDLAKIKTQEAGFKLIVVNDKPDTKEVPLVYYLDNIRGGFEKRKVKVDQTVDFGGLFDAITASFSDSDIVDFTVTDGDDKTVTEGVNGTNMTFTPKDKGEYTIHATLQKPDYRDLTLEIQVAVELQDFLPYDLSFEDLAAGDSDSIKAQVAPVFTNIQADAKAIRDTWHTDGSLSLCLEYTSSINFTMDIDFIEDMRKVYDTINFDMRVIGNGYKLGVNNSLPSKPADIPCASGQMYTVTLSKAFLDATIASGSGIPFVWVDDIGGEKRWGYIDNIRGGFETQKTVFDKTFDISGKLNTIASNFSATLVDFRIEDDGETTVSTGMSFMPAAAGDYMIYVSLTKTGYNSIDIKLPLIVSIADFLPYDMSFENLVTGDSNSIKSQVAPIFTNIQAGANAIRDSWNTDGSLSLCLEHTSSINFTMDIDFIRDMRKAYDTISFDMKVSGSGYKLGVNNSLASKPADIPCTSGQIYTVTLSKAFLDATIASGSGIPFVWVDSIGGEKRWAYIDNIRGGFDTQAINYGETFNAGTVKLNAIATAFAGSSITGFKVENSSNQTITDGVDTSALTFTPADSGNYTVFATLTKTGYNPVEIELLLTVNALNFLTYDMSFETLAAGDSNNLKSQVAPIFPTVGGIAHRDTATGVTEGGVSLCLEMNGNTSFTMSLDFIWDMYKIYDTIEFDIKVAGTGYKLCINGYTGDSDRPADVVCTSGQFYTFKLSKAFLAKVTAGTTDLPFIWVNESGESTSRWSYIDNIRGGFETRSINYGETFNAGTAKLNAIATAFTGSSITNFRVENSSNQSITEGVDISALTFTPANSGNHTIFATLTKTGYNPVEIEMPLTVNALNFLPYDNLNFEKSTSDETIAATAGLIFNTALVPKLETGTNKLEGDKTLYFSGGANMYLNFSNAFIKNIAKIYDTLSFDVKVVGGTIRYSSFDSTANGRPADITFNSGEIKTITFGKQYLDYIAEGNSDASFIFVDVSATVWTFFDNFRGGFATQTTSVAAAFDAGSYLSARVTALGATLTGFTVKDSSNGTVTNGIDAGNLKFTSDTAGNYTVHVTLTKTGYNPLELAIPLTVT